MSASPPLDVVIVGAGLAGIGSAYWLQRRCPGKTFAVLEARQDLGGTWDLFRYPGIRSDSDMFTFGYRFEPWSDPQPLSGGERIMAYLRETARKYGITERIRFGHRVEHAAWSGREALWTLRVRREAEGDTVALRCRFLYLCTGYYDYGEAHRPRFPGEDAFAGRIVEPQFWPADLDWTDRRVVVVGSGATAVTLVPALSEKAASVTMLQRSPTYIMNLPNRNGLFLLARRFLPLTAAYRLARWQNIGGSMLLYALSRRFPDYVRRQILKGAAAQLPPGYPVEEHFNPRYDPWDQRLCVVPDGDLFTAIREGRAEVVTDTIDRFVPEGIRLAGGRTLPADLIVLATGLKIRILGGATVSIDGQPFDPHGAMMYKGMMISGVPNAAIAFGYTNASWTLKTDLTAGYVTRLLRHMDRRGHRVVVPRRDPAVREEPFMDFSAGYIQRALDILPHQGHRRPWRVHQNYLMDMLTTRLGRIDDGALDFRA
jgi:monooxygenase